MKANDFDYSLAPHDTHLCPPNIKYFHESGVIFFYIKE